MISLIVLFGFVIWTNGQNFISAGQTEGENVFFVEFDPPLFATIDYQQHDSILLDIDLDGVNDMIFHIYVAANRDFTFTSWIEFISDSIFVIQSQKYSNYVRKLPEGHFIDDIQDWINGNNNKVMLKYVKYNFFIPPYDIYYVGDFGGQGYMGFKFIKPYETYYGWIRLSPGETSMKLFEFATRGLTVGTNKLDSSTRIRFYPNPVHSHIVIELDELLKNDALIEITDARGLLLLSKQIKAYEQRFIFDVSHLEMGMYLLKVIENNAAISYHKFLKIKQ